MQWANPSAASKKKKKSGELCSLYQWGCSSRTPANIKIHTKTLFSVTLFLRRGACCSCKMPASTAALQESACSHRSPQASSSRVKHRVRLDWTCSSQCSAGLSVWLPPSTPCERVSRVISMKNKLPVFPCSATQIKNQKSKKVIMGTEIVSFPFPETESFIQYSPVELVS